MKWKVTGYKSIATSHAFLMEYWDNEEEAVVRVKELQAKYIKAVFLCYQVKTIVKPIKLGSPPETD